MWNFLGAYRGLCDRGIGEAHPRQRLLSGKRRVWLVSQHLHRFYRLQDSPVQGGASDREPGLSYEYWEPTWCQPLPPGNWSPTFWAWFLFDRLRVFRSNGYGVFLISQGRKVIHRSCIFPAFFRFPFMKEGDLQVGYLWTDPCARGKGLATAALREICQRVAGTGISLWYLVEETNAASIRVVEKAGFELVGFGQKHPRLGVVFLGYYSIDQFGSVAPNNPRPLNGK